MNQIQQNNKQKVLLILLPLVQQLFPSYDKKSIQVAPLFGTTNQVFKVTVQKHNHYVFRFLSPILDRKRQGKIMIELSEKNIIPKCYFTSETCRLDQYIGNARHPKPSEILSNITIIKSIMEKLSQFHNVVLSQQDPGSVISLQIFSPQKIKKYKESQPHQSYQQNQFNYFKAQLLSSLTEMKQWVSNHFSPNHTHKIKLCHNDLNNLNLFIRQNSRGDTEAIFIDFQYIGYNFLAYDIANILNQTTFQYSGPTPGFINTKKITKEEVQLACKFYQNKYQGLEEDVLKMLAIVNYYWAFWSIMIAPSETFNALQHGFTRWELVKHYRSLFT